MLTILTTFHLHRTLRRAHSTSGSGAWGLAARFHDNFLVIRTTHNHVALHGIVDAENAIELGDLSGVSVEVDEGVVTLRELVDLVGELALAPVVDVVDLATVLGESDFDALHNASARLIGDRGIDKKQQFISLHVVTSSGHVASGREGLRPRQERSVENLTTTQLIGAPAKSYRAFPPAQSHHMRASPC